MTEKRLSVACFEPKSKRFNPQNVLTGTAVLSKFEIKVSAVHFMD